MKQILNYLLIVGLFTTAVFCQGNVRFANAIQSKSIQIQTNLFPTISLDYTGVSSYESSSDGSVQITNIIDTVSGNSLINNQPQMIYFSGFYATVAIVLNNGQAVCVLYNETLTDSMENGSLTSAFVRFIDLAQLNFTNLQGSGNPNSAILFSYEGYLVNTPYVEVDPRFTSLLIVQAGTSNQWSVPTSFSVSSLYTIFFFGSNGVFSGVATYDRTIPNGVSTSGAAATTGEPIATTGTVPATTGVASITPSPSQTGTINPQTSSASQTLIGMTVAIAAVALAF